MLDKNGIEMKTGDVVRIENAFFKNDNGFWFVSATPGDPSWLGKDYSLKKIGKTGKISTARGSIAFWPLKAFTNDRCKNYEAQKHNESHATIEIVNGMIDRSKVAEHFRDESLSLSEAARDYGYRFGEESEWALKYKETADFYSGVAERIATC